jgi:hypothetical protein
MLLAPLVACQRSDVPGKPHIDPSTAATKALELLDKNSDSFIDQQELAASPGLAEGRSRVDIDQDGRISSDELAARFAYWNQSISRIVCPELEITLNRRPVPMAQVVFLPEPFLADWLEEVQASTDEFGRCTPRISRDLPGVNMGYYRVQVTKQRGGKQLVAAQFNTQTQIGVEFCDDRPADEHQLIRLQLSTRKRR